MQVKPGFVWKPDCVTSEIMGIFERYETAMQNKSLSLMRFTVITDALHQQHFTKSITISYYADDNIYIYVTLSDFSNIAMHLKHLCELQETT